MIQNPWRRAIASSAVRSSWLAVHPVGFDGETTTSARVRERDGRREPVEIERPALIAEIHRHLDGPRAGDAGGGCRIRPGRRRDDHLVAFARGHGERDLDRLHAGAGDEEFLGREVAAVEARVIAGQRVAQFRDAALPRIERLTGGERLRGGLGDEGGRGEIAFARPKPHDAVASATVIHRLDDAALRRVVCRAAQARQQRFRQCRLVHDSSFSAFAVLYRNRASLRSFYIDQHWLRGCRLCLENSIRASEAPGKSSRCSKPLMHYCEPQTTISTSAGPSAVQTKHTRNWSLILIECCPLRSPANASRRLPGSDLKSPRSPAALR